MAEIPKKILSTSLPSLIHAAKYARFIQNRIHALEEKEGSTNIFQAALSDADLTIQAQLEVTLLAEFPEIPFYGEEHQSSRNTRYLSGTNFVPGCNYLITLDPIDGTRPYIDGKKTFQIILTVCAREHFEAVLVVYPWSERYVYALRGKGVFQGSFSTPFERCERLSQPTFQNNFYYWGDYDSFIPQFSKLFTNIYSPNQYTKSNRLPDPGGFIWGELRAGLMVSAQILDGAAFAFVAQELGFMVETIDGLKFPKPEDYADLVMPGLIIGDTKETIESIRKIIL